MTAYIVQISLGDTPQGTLEYRTIFAVGMLLFLGTFGLNLVSAWLRERYPRGVRVSPAPRRARCRSAGTHVGVAAVRRRGVPGRRAGRAARRPRLPGRR